MASKPKKLPSGNWRCQVSYVDGTGKRRFQSFTARTRREVIHSAELFEFEIERIKDATRLSLGEAMTLYIEEKESVLSPTTLRSYRAIREHAFQSIMHVRLTNITSDLLNAAVREEMERPVEHGNKKRSPKAVQNAYGLVSAVLHKYMPEKTFTVDLPKKARRIRDLPSPKDVYDAVKGTWIELPVLLAMWLSFTMSEIRGLTKSKSINGDYITIREVLVMAGGGNEVRKEIGKNTTRNRRHRIPPYIKDLIDQVDGDIICPYSASHVLSFFQSRLEKAGVEKISFHDLRHLSASTMAFLRIPNIYAMERGGWSDDKIMKTVYMETLSEQRLAVDQTINDYFESIISGS